MKAKALLSLTLAGLLFLSGCGNKDNQNDTPTNSSGDNPTTDTTSTNTGGDTPVSDEPSSAEKAALINLIDNIESVTLVSKAEVNGAMLVKPHRHSSSPDPLEEYKNEKTYTISTMVYENNKTKFSYEMSTEGTIRLRDYFDEKVHDGTFEDFIPTFIDEYFGSEGELDYSMNGGIMTYVNVMNYGTQYAVRVPSYNQVYEASVSEWSTSKAKYAEYGKQTLYDTFQMYMTYTVLTLQSGTWNKEASGYVLDGGSQGRFTLVLNNKQLSKMVVVYHENEIDEDITTEYVISGINDSTVVVPFDDPCCANGDHHHAYHVKISDEQHWRRCEECGLYIGNPESHDHVEGYPDYCPVCEEIVGLEDNYTVRDQFSGNGPMYYESYAVFNKLYKTSGDEYIASQSDYVISSRCSLIDEYNSNPYYGFKKQVDGETEFYIVGQATTATSISGCAFIYTYRLDLYKVNAYQPSLHTINNVTITEWMATTPQVVTSLTFKCIKPHHSYTDSEVIIDECHSMQIKTCTVCGRIEETMDVHHSMSEFTWYSKGQTGFDNNVAQAFLDNYYPAAWYPDADIEIYGVSHCYECDEKEYIHPKNAFTVSHDTQTFYPSSFDLLDTSLNEKGTAYFDDLLIPHEEDENHYCHICGGTFYYINFNEKNFRIVVDPTKDPASECPLVIKIVGNSYAGINSSFFILQGDGVTYKASSIYDDGVYYNYYAVKQIQGGNLTGYEVTIEKQSDSSKSSSKYVPLA